MHKLKKYKKVYLTRTHKYIITFLLVLLTLGVGYAALTSDLSISGNMIVKKYYEPNLFKKIVNLSKTDSCISKYSGEVTDQVGQTVEATNVYFNKCADKRNVIFNNMCWQVVRTTETGGVKMIYNGDAVDGKCESTRGNHKGIVQSNPGVEQSVNTQYMYGSSFTYNTSNNTFTLNDTFNSTWNSTTYSNLIGKFTCKSTSSSCTTLYIVNAAYSSTEAYLSDYKIAATNYSVLGSSSFNADYYSPANVGYMFRNVFNVKIKNASSISGTIKFGSSFSYNTSTSTYTISGTTYNISNWSNSYNNIKNTHYTCWNSDGTCTKVSYVNYSTSSDVYYFEISSGKNVNNIINEMLFSDNVNTYNSSIKSYIDAWYKQNMISKTNMLEDTVYCNSRNIIEYGGWNPNGGNTSISLQFRNYVETASLSCINVNDQFSLSNDKARLIYPIGLLTEEERTINNLASLLANGVEWWTMSPDTFNSYHANVRFISFDGLRSGTSANRTLYVRPVISLKNNIEVESGSGSETDPWIVE